MKKITHKLLKSWSPCTDGYKRFCELFPDGADLQTAIDGLVKDGHDDWGYWLFQQCRDREIFKNVTDKGYRNSGNQNSGHRNSGDRNSGHRNSGNRNSGDQNSGHRNSGDLNSGHLNSGHRNSGHRNSGDRNSGHRNSGDRNSGNQNSGHRNSGDRNSGDWNSGHRNSGNRNSGDQNSGNQNSGDWNSSHLNSGNLNSGNLNSGHRNSGNRNSGDRNSGDWNSGNQNSGSWNSGHRNSGYFNTITPEDILVFNKPLKRSEWDKADKPSFIYFDLCVWVDESAMSDQEKIDNPKFYVAGGYLKERNYKECFREAWEEADRKDREKLRLLPNFDAKIFEEISGINVDEETI